MAHEWKGKIVEVSDIEGCKGKFSRKVTMIIEDSKGVKIAFLLFDGQIEALLKPVEIGDDVTVTFSVKSHEYKGSYITSCFCINLEKIVKKQQHSYYQTTGSWQSTERDDWKTMEDEKEQFWENIKRRAQQQSTDYFAGCNTKEEAKKRYRELSKVHHPDRGGLSSTMSAINNEYDKWK